MIAADLTYLSDKNVSNLNIKGNCITITYKKSIFVNKKESIKQKMVIASNLTKSFQKLFLKSKTFQKSFLIVLV